MSSNIHTEKPLISQANKIVGLIDAELKFEKYINKLLKKICNSLKVIYENRQYLPEFHCFIQSY